ncbi:recombination regulator RecX [Pasteurellaceae bacterium RH1A]|nr:recombination regulator RecX [Pasteurellaceae bacterium RH1A]
MQKYSATQYLVYLLARRDYSEQELRQRLKRKEYSEQEAEEALAKAQEHNWQSDVRFCATYVRSRSQQGYGPRRIQQELYHKGIAQWLIEQTLEEAEIDWYELAEYQFNKKRPEVWDIKAKQKMWRFMLSRGFENDHFRDLMDLDYDE